MRYRAVVGRVENDGLTGLKQRAGSTFHLGKDEIACQSVSTVGLKVAAYVVRADDEGLQATDVLSSPGCSFPSRETDQDVERRHWATPHTTVVGSLQRIPGCLKTYS